MSGKAVHHTQVQKGVAFLLNFAPRSWSTRDDMFLRLSQAFRARDVAPVVVTSEPLPDLLASRYCAAGTQLEVIKYGKGVAHCLIELRRVVKEHSITMVYIRHFNAFTGLPWLVWALGVRDIVLSDAEGGLLRATSWKKALLRFRMRLLTHPTTRLTAISHFVKRRLVDLGIREDKIEVIYNGVDTRRFCPNPEARAEWARRFPIRRDEVILATASALLPIKDIPSIVESLGLIISRGVSARLFVAGEGPLRAELEELSRKLGLAERIYWLGYVDDPGL